ncbi:Chemotaxis signal transduction protein [Hahella chejuensis KCTC 2396]|uniref:Chemotaxis signal transduction protein n=1 Tax=Hahella chejuensis (strain KCTC 2396) TaxID=349521 RepID=Q2SFJ7_HAHCH|nr:chemotaxis protein CheW [Hahella chejuensis]ABC30577.1 Chemotaxis signal transduction protein [Hahella chejuensis KCTC 2396]
MKGSTYTDWEALKRNLQQVEQFLANEFNPSPDSARARLQDRARELAEPEKEEDESDRMEALVFELAQETYALEPEFIAEVVPLKPPTPVPCTPPYVLGVIGVRGRIVSVLDLRVFFDLPLKGLSDRNSVVVLSQGGREFGLLTDRVAGIRIVSRSSLNTRLDHLSGVRKEYLLGVTPSHWAVLDAYKLLNDSRLIVNDRV